MRQLLIRFALWLLEKCGYQFPKAEAPMAGKLADIIALAKPLVAEQNERWPDRSGEAKKHAVYAYLIKKLPDKSKRDISLAIELALE